MSFWVLLFWVARIGCQVMEKANMENMGAGNGEIGLCQSERSATE